MGSAALVAAVARQRQGDPKFPLRINEIFIKNNFKKLISKSGMDLQVHVLNKNLQKREKQRRQTVRDILFLELEVEI